MCSFRLGEAGCYGALPHYSATPKQARTVRVATAMAVVEAEEMAGPGILPPYLLVTAAADEHWRMSETVVHKSSKGTAKWSLQKRRGGCWKNDQPRIRILPGEGLLEE